MEEPAVQLPLDKRQRIERLSRLIDVSKSMAAQLDLEPLLQQIVDSANLLLRARMGGLMVLYEDNSGVQYFKVSGWTVEVKGNPRGMGILSLPYRQSQTLRLDDVRMHPQARGFPENHPVVGPFLSAPLLSKGKALGALFVGNEPGGQIFSAEDEELLVAFAAQATVAIENARLYAKAEELARLQERQRIAQALHDTVVQMLFSIGLEAEWCLTHIPAAEGFPQRLQTIRRLAARSSDELRSAIFALRSPFLAPGDGLVQLIQAQVSEFEGQSGIAATLIVMPCFPTLPPLVSEAVYRIVVESLSNVRKHARASGVMVSLDCDGSSVTVTIQDNGVGLAEPLSLEVDDSSLHFGVATMRQVTAQAEGAFFIANNDDQGVMIKARFPLSGDLLS
ncbi:MAG: GAF domain-containing sensor histidine kinase [Chloroflexi bacterium]|jgi:signal transduction histidine kinase|nr:GAF domain-containing sensor histidine kinase [Anaerolineaceae bacterium]NMB90858.1 GAF domain-containing sensor histidine kinase [Chloroflexota bacterium]